MNDQGLQKLLRVVGNEPSQEIEMPFGFDTRVLSLLRGRADTPDFITAWSRRVALISGAIIVLAGFGWYQTNNDDDLSSAYAMTDTVIERNLSR